MDIALRIGPSVICCVLVTIPRESTAGPIITTIAGTGQSKNNGDSGLAGNTNIGWPFGVEIGPDGALYITECTNHRVRRLELNTGQLTTVAGNGQRGWSGDGEAATDARLDQPYEVRFGQDGNMYFVEMRNHLVRCVDERTKRISTVAGNGESGFAGDGGVATNAQLKVPHSIALDKNGFLYIADIGNHRIRRLDIQRGTINTIAGTGEVGFPVDGARAKDSPLAGPRALAVQGRTLWVVLRNGHSVWKLDLDRGTLHHCAGTGTPGYTGDGGPAKVASFNGPKGVAVGQQGDLFIVDSENDAVRRIDHITKTITTVAGHGPARAFAGDGGHPLKALLSQPHGICVAADGTVYIGDTFEPSCTGC